MSSDSMHTNVVAQRNEMVKIQSKCQTSAPMPLQRKIRLLSSINPIVHLIAIKPAIPTGTPRLISIISPPTHLTMRSISTRPRFPRKRKANSVIINPRSRNLQHIRQIAIDTQSLTRSINKLLRNLSDGFVAGVINDDIEIIICTNAILIALVLLDMHSAPAWRIAGAMNKVVAVETEAVVDARPRDVADPAEALSSRSSTLPAAEIVFVLAGVGVGVGVGFDVEGVPIVDVRELEDGAVETVFCVAVYAAGFGEGNGEVADVGVGEVLAA